MSQILELTITRRRWRLHVQQGAGRSIECIVDGELELKASLAALAAQPGLIKFRCERYVGDGNE